MEYTGVEKRIVEYSGIYWSTSEDSGNSGIYTGVEQRIVECSGIYWSRAEDRGKQSNILE